MAIEVENIFETRSVGLIWVKDQFPNINIKSTITESNAPHVTEYLKFLNAISKGWFLGEIVMVEHKDVNTYKLIDGNKRLFFIEQLLSETSIYKVYFNWKTRAFF